MGDDVVVSVKHVSKKYCKSLRASMRYGVQDIARNLVGMKSHGENLREREFWALDDVSFDVRRGEAIGIIGPNGSGKTTLLKLLNGIFWPDKGRISVTGKVGVLIELGAGFHPLLTGRENIYINAAILGMTKREVDDRFDSIVAFADIGDFIDTPVKYYSSGMFVRLGFAVAIHSDPDILLIDEVLAVGDIQFQVKCFRKLASFKEMGKTLFLVSHDMGAIQRQTERVILLHRGALHCVDHPKDAVNKYLSLMSTRIAKKLEVSGTEGAQGRELEIFARRNGTEVNLEDDRCFLRTSYNHNEFRYGSGGARIVDFELLDEEGKEVAGVKSNETIFLRVNVRFYDHVEKPIFGLAVKTKEGVELYGTNTLVKDMEPGPGRKGEEVLVEYRINLPLQSGDYFLSVGVSGLSANDIVPLDRRYDLLSVSVLPADKSFGIVNLNATIRVETGGIFESSKASYDDAR